MFKKFFTNIKDIDKSILKAMFKGFNFSMILSVISLYILYLYSTYPVSYILLEAGLLLFKCSLMFLSSFFICAFAIDAIKKQVL